MKITKPSMFLLITALCIIIIASTYSQDWPQWRGINRDGKVMGFNAPQKWPEKFTQKWKLTVGMGDATPALVNNKLYVFTRQGENEITMCLNADDGKEIWRDKYSAQPVTGAASQHPGPRSSPTVANGKVITLGVSNILSCLDAETGKVAWRNSEYAGQVPLYFAAMSPIVIDGLVIAHLGGEEEGAIIAFDLNNGNQKWKWTGDGPAYASPVLMNVENTKMIIEQTKSDIVSIATADGTLLWEIPSPAERRFYNSATPIVNGQTVIYTGQGQGTKAFKIQKEGNNFSAVELWINEELGTAYNTPVLKDGWLFGLSDRGKLYCMNASTGKTAWIDDTNYKNFGAILDAGSVMLALPSNSELIAYKPDEKKYTELAHIKVADTPTYAHPVIAGKRIYVKDQETLAQLLIE